MWSPNFRTLNSTISEKIKVECEIILAFESGTSLVPVLIKSLESMSVPQKSSRPNKYI